MCLTIIEISNWEQAPFVKLSPTKGACPARESRYFVLPDRSSSLTAFLAAK